MHPWWISFGSNLTEVWWAPEPVWTIWRRKKISVNVLEIEQRIPPRPFPTLITKPRLHHCFFKITVNITFTNTIMCSKWWRFSDLKVFSFVAYPMCALRPSNFNHIRMIILITCGEGLKSVRAVPTVLGPLFPTLFGYVALFSLKIQTANTRAGNKRVNHRNTWNLFSYWQIATNNAQFYL